MRMMSCGRPTTQQQQKGVTTTMQLAYLDPGSGGMLAAALVAGFAGAAVTVKVWWRRIWGKIRKRPVDAPASPDQDD